MPREPKATTSISKKRDKVNVRPAEDGDSFIPRPPNAWILFRAVEQKKLLQTRGKLPQVTVSKILSEMWKDAPENVRADYERLAEEKKKEHGVLYPHYRFQPKKKEEKKLEKQRRKATGVKKTQKNDVSETSSLQVYSTSSSPVVPVALTMPPLTPVFPQRCSVGIESDSATSTLHVTDIHIAQPRPVVANPWPLMHYGLYTPRQSAEPSPGPASRNSGMLENFGSVAPFFGAVTNTDDEVLEISAEELALITPDFDNSARNHPHFQLHTPPYVPGWDFTTTADEQKSTNGVLTQEAQTSDISGSIFYQTTVNAVVSDNPSEGALHVSADPVFDSDLKTSGFNLQYVIAAGILNFEPNNIHDLVHGEYFFDV